MLWILTFDSDVALSYCRVNHFHHFTTITLFLFHNTQKFKKNPNEGGLTVSVYSVLRPMFKDSQLTKACFQLDGGFSRSSDRNGYILKDVRYERNKLYVLGLHHRVTKECLLHYIEKISSYDVKHILWFKPNGRAIVTLDAETIGKFTFCFSSFSCKIGRYTRFLS